MPIFSLRHPDHSIWLLLLIMVASTMDVIDLRKHSPFFLLHFYFFFIIIIISLEIRMIPL